ncbi:MAG: hypothetical protein GWN01_12150, partial [Nitrosopumilaceae archaeon]|nr:hypothetical protein [Nitrosopumilaceae archaeon]NIU88046.1 hypothetical protein [Nitrosopumilaceae archaeon]NIX62230.1 hypothetical protein [Nitrosopumilaceae archaeon]
VEKFRELEKRSDLKEFKFLAELYIINVEDEELFVDVVIEQDGEILDDYTGDSYGYVDRVAKDSVVCYLQDREDIEPHKYPAGE